MMSRTFEQARGSVGASVSSTVSKIRTSVLKPAFRHIGQWFRSLVPLVPKELLLIIQAINNDSF